jgi:hypothetical protein
VVERRSGNARVGADDQHHVVRGVAGEAEDGRVQVLVVAGEVDEGDELRRGPGDLFSRLAAVVVYDFALSKYK